MRQWGEPVGLLLALQLLSEQSNQRVSIRVARVARPEVRRACESLVPFTELPTPIANVLSVPHCAWAVLQIADRKNYVYAPFVPRWPYCMLKDE